MDTQRCNMGVKKERFSSCHTRSNNNHTNGRNKGINTTWHNDQMRLVRLLQHSTLLTVHTDEILNHAVTSAHETTGAPTNITTARGDM